MADVKSGRKKRIRARIAKRILNTDSSIAADASLIPAKDTWKMINHMVSMGYTKGEIAQRIGAKCRGLQLRKHLVLRSTEQRVRKLYTTVIGEVELERTLPKICSRCGFSHQKTYRMTYLRHTLPNKAEDIKEAWPCIYGGTSGERQLFRDLRSIHAVANDGIWKLP